MDQSSTVMADFFAKLSTSIEHGELSSSQHQAVTDFYMTFQFRTHAEQENGDVSTESELMRFLFTGWYVYKCLDQQQ
jgi:hypothetical protein